MPRYGLSGLCLKAQMLRKSLKAYPSKRHEIGSLPVVKLGSKNAGKNEMAEVDGD